MGNCLGTSGAAGIGSDVDAAYRQVDVGESRPNTDGCTVVVSLFRGISPSSATKPHQGQKVLKISDGVILMQDILI